MPSERLSVHGSFHPRQMRPMPPTPNMVASHFRGSRFNQPSFSLDMSNFQKYPFPAPDGGSRFTVPHYPPFVKYSGGGDPRDTGGVMSKSFAGLSSINNVEKKGHCSRTEGRAMSVLESVLHHIVTPASV